MTVGLSVTTVSTAKTTEPIEMTFGMRTRVDPRNYMLDWVYIGATWRIRLNRPCAAAMRPYVIISLTTCYVVVTDNSLRITLLNISTIH